MAGFIYDPVRWCVMAPWLRDHRPSHADLVALQAALDQAADRKINEVAIYHPDKPPRVVPRPTEVWLRGLAEARAVYPCGHRVLPKPLPYADVPLVRDPEWGPMSATLIQLYRRWFAKFVGWCEARGESALPASDETVAAFLGEIAARSSRGLCCNAIECHHRGAGHPTPRIPYELRWT
jgi:hypothetical protein